MDKRRVIYNGGTQKYTGKFSSPDKLIVGKEYELLYSRQYPWHTEYVLKEVEGVFNSCWFDGITDYPQTFLAVSNIFPEVGNRLECYTVKYNVNEGQPLFIHWSTSPVVSIQELGTNIVYVTTQNSIYIVQVS